MWQQAVSLFESFFVYTGLSWNYLAIGILLGIAFGAIWLCAHWPPLFKKPWLWAVAAVSAFITVPAIAFIQFPLQTWTGQALYHFWSATTLNTWLLLAGIPQMLLTGLVQEGAKMLPMLAWWWRSGKNIPPRLGLAIGAIAGAGFGVFEAIWVHNRMFIAGWTPQAFQMDGFLAVAGFWERFFAVGFHIAVSALVGYGLAKGKGWKFYLIAAVLHALLNYTTLFMAKGYLTIVQLELVVAVIAVGVTMWVLLLRWGRATEPEAEAEIEGGTVAPPPTDVQA
jgi:RsiW-degrading membrane proteinase PrsW (M82 family)